MAFSYGNTQHLEDACDVLTDHGLELEAGPPGTRISQAQFVYVLEPGGNRIELVGSRRVHVTDPSLGAGDAGRRTHLDSAIIWYGSPLPTEFDTYGTPHCGPTDYRTPNRAPPRARRRLHRRGGQPAALSASTRRTPRGGVDAVEEGEQGAR